MSFDTILLCEWIGKDVVESRMCRGGMERREDTKKQFIGIIGWSSIEGLNRKISLLS